MTLRFRGTTAVSIAILGGLLVAPGASANLSVNSSGSTQVTATSDAAADNITVNCTSGKVFVVGSGATVVNCTDLDRLTINGNDGNDSINLSAVTRAVFPKLRFVTIDGGTGAFTDSVVGSEVNDTITGISDNVNGGGGDDVITEGQQVTGGDGNDTLINSAGPSDGGPGDDVFQQPAGLGPYTGGPGYDAFTYSAKIFDDQVPPVAADFTLSISDTQFGINFTSPVTQVATVVISTIERANLDGINGGTQTIDASAFSGDLHADGRGGPDTLLGGAGEDFLTGGAGDDTIDGGLGFDYVDAGAGADTLRLRDNGADRALCGSEADSVTADAADVLKDCETVDVPAPPDTTAPDTTGLKGPKSVKAKKAAKFTFGSSEAGSTFTCKLDKAAATACTSPFSTKVKKPGKHTLTVTATDAAGNADATPASVDFTVKKAKKKNQK